jgi:hypothetical protein
LSGSVLALAIDVSGSLYAGGEFITAGGVSANRIAKWDGAVWSVLGSGMNGTAVWALAIDGSGNLYAGGDFTTAGGAPANNIAKWDGVTWSPLGSGMTGTYYSYVSALSIDLKFSGNLYAGGVFTSAGGVNANNIAKWAGGAWSPLGAGLSGDWVHALAIDGSGNLYAGGYFNTAGVVSAGNIAKWDGAAWSPLGSGVNGDVYALAIDGSGNLYAGGMFDTAGGVSANNIAEWDGIAWYPLGSGINGTSTLSALAIDGSYNLYAGGRFTSAGGKGSSNIAKALLNIPSATHYTVFAPQTATAGAPFSFTVTALDQYNHTATGYTGTVHFTSSDTAAVLPADATLTKGTGMFSATLNTTGSPTKITATDTATATITGTSGNITVNPAAALSIAFNGSGSGSVTSTSPAAPAINCIKGSSNGCSADYPLNTSITLAATPDWKSVFSDWSGGLTSKANPFTFNIGAGKTLTATFDPNYKAKLLPGGALFASIQDAYASISSGSVTIRAQAWPFIEDLLFGNGTAVTLTGGMNGGYIPTTGYSTVKSLTVERGSAVIGNIIIK